LSYQPNTFATDPGEAGIEDTRCGVTDDITGDHRRLGVADDARQVTGRRGREGRVDLGRGNAVERITCRTGS
jgi:hypothetical protein